MACLANEMCEGYEPRGTLQPGVYDCIHDTGTRCDFGVKMLERHREKAANVLAGFSGRTVAATIERVAQSLAEVEEPGRKLASAARKLGAKWYDLADEVWLDSPDHADDLRSCANQLEALLKEEAACEGGATILFPGEDVP